MYFVNKIVSVIFLTSIIILNTILIPTALATNITNGAKIFNANCASCHKLDKHMTGPALRNIGQKCDTITITNFLHSAKTLIESKGYETSYMYFPKLTVTDISNILR